MPRQSLLDFGQTQSALRPIPISDAALSFNKDAFSDDESDRYLDTLTHDTPWRHDRITIHGRTIPLPRLQAWYADNGASLRYSGMTVAPLEFTEALHAIRRRVYDLTGVYFNSALVNCYRNGNDSVGWHRDNEPEFGPDPIIGSVSFGATREFVLKHVTKRTLPPITVRLTHGSLLLMGEGVQRFWKHQLPKRKRVTEARINLTFRNVTPT